MDIDRRTLLAMGLATAPAIASAQARVDWTGLARVMQRPMLGWCGPTEASVWVRVDGPHRVCIEYDVDPAFSRPRRTAELLATQDQHWSRVHLLTGLMPDTRYAYRVLVNGAPNADTVGVEPARLHTAPAGPARFRLAFGSCARRQRYPVQPIWSAIETARPDLFVWAGDNVYADSLDPAILSEEYRRQRDLPEIRRFLAQTPQLAIWDDHDYGLNDQDRRHPKKEGALRAFTTYWPNPAAGLPQTPGAFFRHSYGGVDFFFLDVRYYRDPDMEPDRPGKTMLGEAQFDWLVSALRGSTAPFKVLISGSGWTDGKPVGGDSWASFAHERERLFRAIEAYGISGIILLSGDTHFGELNRLPRADGGGYDFHELVSSPLAQEMSAPRDDWRPVVRVRPPYTSDVNFGVVDFDLTGSDPTASLGLRNERGEAVWQPIVLHSSELHARTRSTKS